MSQNTAASDTAQVGGESCPDPGCKMVPGYGPFASSHLDYAAAGWRGTLKLPRLAKSPVPIGLTGKNGGWPDKKALHAWSHDNGANIGLRVPEEILVIDVDQYDDKTGADQLEALEVEWGKLPATWISTSRGLASRSGKRFFRVPAGKHWPTDPAPNIEALQFGHRYAVVWPSIVTDKTTGEERQERWYNPKGILVENSIPTLDELPDLPDEWIRGLMNFSTTANGGGTDASLADLISLPADDAGRGNDWASKMVGKLVAVAHSKDGLSREDVSELALAVNQMSTDPMEPEVILGMVARFWASDSADMRKIGLKPPALSSNTAEDETADEFTCGPLFRRPDGKCGYSTRREFVSKKGKETEVVTFSDFELKATSVNTFDGQTMWVVDLYRDDGAIFPDVELPSSVLASTVAMRNWAMGFQCSLYFTDDRDKHGSAGIRLQRLLRDQNPVDCRVVSHLGWEDSAQGFITYEGIITAEGVKTDAKVRPARDLATRNLVDHYYGFTKSEREVREVLREILTFHDETFTSVFTSWMVAGVIKGQLVRQSSLFPIFLVQAASESGKSKGFSQLIHQMFGNRTKEGSIGTTASIRNSLTAHRGAPVHIDDADNVDNIKELLRQATVEGAADKTGEDKQSTVRSRLLAPVWISMEGSTLLEDKALSDRIVSMSMPNPKGRRSLKDPSKPQWDDILELMNRFGGENGLTEFSGTLVKMILRSAATRIGEFTNMRSRSNSASSGRHADKMAVLRVGARVLADLTGDLTHIERVDSWSGGVKDKGDENALTMKLIPELLTVIGPVSRPVRADRAPHYGVPTPVIISPPPGDRDAPDSMWVHTGYLATWWAQHKRGKINERTETEAALEDQAGRLGMLGRSAGKLNTDWAQFDVDRSQSDPGAKRTRLKYRRVPDHVSASILASLSTEVGAEDVRDPSRLSPAQVMIIDRSSLN